MNSLEVKIIGHVERVTRAAYGNLHLDPGHRIDHTERVVVNTLKICQGEDIPIFKPTVAAWLHDIGRPAEYLARRKGIILDHAEASARQALVILRPFREKLGEDVIFEIKTAVATHGKLNSPNDSLAAKTLKDADRLDGLGSAGLVRTITALHQNPLCDLSNPFPDIRVPRGSETLPQITIAQGMLYTIEWFTMLRMSTAIRMGVLRVQRQIGFLEGLVEELGLSADLLEQNEIIQEARRVMQQVPNVISFRTL